MVHVLALNYFKFEKKPFIDYFLSTILLIKIKISMFYVEIKKNAWVHVQNMLLHYHLCTKRNILNYLNQWGDPLRNFISSRTSIKHNHVINCMHATDEINMLVFLIIYYCTAFMLTFPNRNSNLNYYHCYESLYVVLYYVARFCYVIVMLC